MMVDRRTFNEVYSSDNRVKGGIIAKCKLCEKTKQLRLSHIIPKWIYKNIVTKEGCLIAKYNSLGSLEVKHQDGTKQYMLCSECEEYLGEGENYVKKVMSMDPVLLKKINVKLDNNFFNGINFSLLKRFILGVAFKAHHCDRAEFYKFNVHRKMLDKMRNDLLNDSLTTEEVNILAFKYTSSFQNFDTECVVVFNYSIGNSGIPAIHLLAYNWEWVALVHFNKLSRKKLCNFESNFMKNDKPFEILQGDILDCELFKKYISAHNG